MRRASGAGLLELFCRKKTTVKITSSTCSVAQVTLDAMLSTRGRHILSKQSPATGNSFQEVLIAFLAPGRPNVLPFP